MMNAKNHDSRFKSFASFSYFSIVRLSTLSVRYRMFPDNVDLPASTCPMNTRFTCSRGSPSFTASIGTSFNTGFGFCATTVTAGVVTIAEGAGAASIAISSSFSATASASPSQSSAGTSPASNTAATSGYCINESGSLIMRCALLRSPFATFRTAFQSGSDSSISSSMAVSCAGGADTGVAAVGVHDVAATDGFHEDAPAFIF
mmetsp:Transcript_53385/g.64303  ORF Transcript_53385/g.64303 Transcript_53385/m.64303 type:complete len:203 (+) Transcript_53385:1063-1671(+)